MKKLLTLVLLALILASCDEKRTNEFVISKIEKSQDKSDYRLNQVTHRAINSATIIVNFDDQNFTIGDTLILVKKSDYRKFSYESKSDSSIIKPNQIKK